MKTGVILNLFYFTFSLLSISVKAQNPPFFEKGATWYYDANTLLVIPDVFTNYGILRLKYTKDTLVDGVEAVFIEEKAFNSKGVIHHPDRLGFVMRQEGMKIYLLTDHGFKLYFDFDVKKNDTLKMSTKILPHTLYDEGETEFSMFIDSVSTFDMFDLTFKEYYFSTDLPYLPQLSKVRYKLGINDLYLIFHDPLALDYFFVPSGQLRCYEDAGSQINFVEGLPCDAELITSANELILEDNFRLFPSPASEYIKIANSFTETFDIKIINSQGKVVLELEEYNSGAAIDLSDFLPGYYHILIDDRTVKNINFLKI